MSRILRAAVIAVGALTGAVIVGLLFDSGPGFGVENAVGVALGATVAWLATRRIDRAGAHESSETGARSDG